MEVTWVVLYHVISHVINDVIVQELALLHGTRRTATVSCKDAVELIAVDKEDFVQMNQLDSDEEKEHIRWVKRYV